MSKVITLNLPEQLEQQLKSQAEKLNIPLETVIIKYLSQNSTVIHEENTSIPSVSETENGDQSSDSWIEVINYWKKIKKKLNLSNNFIQHEYLADILKKIKRNLPAIYDNNLVKIFLFGSQARGEAKPQSDIDILIVLKTSVRTKIQKEKYYKFISNLSLEYDVLISCLHISEEQYHNENSPLLINIHREGIIL